MKILRNIVLGVGVLIALLLICGMLMPSKFSVQRSTVIAADPGAIYEKFATPKTWAEWSAWTAQEDPSLEYAYEGPETGQGAVMKWTAKQMGNGRLTITEAVPGQTVRYKMEMEGTSLSVNGHISMEPGQGGTKVTWHDTGDVGGNPIYRLMNPLMDGVLGGAFEKGFDGIRKSLQVS